MAKKKEKSGRRVRPAALVLFVALVLFLWLAPGYLYPILASDIFSEEVQKRRESMYTGVVTIWQVDTFEGGTGSRTAWLNKLLASLEKQYNGVYFVVRSMTPERAKTLLASGNESIMPDMISFGRGLIDNPEELLMQIPEEYYTGLMPELIAACSNYALPWAFGGYAVFADSELAAKHGMGNDISSLPQFLSKLGGPAKYGKTTRDIYMLLGYLIPLKAFREPAWLVCLSRPALAESMLCVLMTMTLRRIFGTAIIIQKASVPCWAPKGIFTGSRPLRAMGKCGLR